MELGSGRLASCQDVGTLVDSSQSLHISFVLTEKSGMRCEMQQAVRIIHSKGAPLTMNVVGYILPRKT